MFVFQDESEAQRQPLNFPNSGIILWIAFSLSSSSGACVYAHVRAECFRKTKERTHTRPTRNDFKTETTLRKEREKKRDEKKNAREIESSDYRGRPFLIYYMLNIFKRTDKPTGSRDANLQLLQRPVRLGAVDPSQGVLLARGVRSFRISHYLCIIVWCRRMYLCGGEKG